MKSRALFLTVALLMPLSAQASDLAHRTVAKVIEGYGGKKFEKLKTLSLYSDLRYGGEGQGEYPDYSDLNPMRKIYHFDFEKGYGSEEAWGAAGGYAERVFYNGDGQYTVNYLYKTYSHDPEADLYSHFGGEMRTSDVLLAYELMKHRKTAEYKGDKMFRGVVHNLVTFDMPGVDIDPVLWVNSETGYISKMRRVIPDYYPISYVFGDFQKEGGISYATDFELYLGDRLIEYAKSRNLTVGWRSRGKWDVENNIPEQPNIISAEEIVVDEVAENVHYAGQFGAWSAFIDEGDHITAIGGSGGLTERFKAYQEDRKHTKPLKYLVVTHHHIDHLASVSDALELGAKIVAPQMTRANLEEIAEAPITDTGFQIISDNKTSLGAIDLHMISTAHAPEFLMPYIKAENIVIDEDHYYGAFEGRATYMTPRGMSFMGEVEKA